MADQFYVDAAGNIVRDADGRPDELVKRHVYTNALTPVELAAALAGTYGPSVQAIASAQVPAMVDPVTKVLYGPDGAALASGGGAAVPADVAVVWGDSIASQFFSEATTDNPVVGTTDAGSGSFNPRAWMNWANALLGSPFRFVFNAGVSGQHSAEILARWSDVKATNAKVCFLVIGRNDITLMSTVYGNDPVATEAGIMANVQQCWDNCLNAGMLVVTGSITPKTAAGGDNATTLGVLNRVNRKLRAAALRRSGIIWVDHCAELTDTSHVNGYARTAAMFDSTHPGTSGAFVVGRAIAQQLKQFVRPYKGLVSSQYDCYQRDSSSTNILSAVDGLFLSATSASANAGITGTQLTAATIARSAGSPTATTTVTAAPAFVDIPDGVGSIGNAQVLDITSTAAGDQIKVTLPSNVTFAQFPAGTKVMGECAVKVENPTNLVGVSCEVSLTYTGGTPASPRLSRMLHTVAAAQAGTGSTPHELVLRTPNVQLPANATGLTQVAFNWYITFSGAGGAKVSICRASLIKS